MKLSIGYFIECVRYFFISMNITSNSVTRNINKINKNVLMTSLNINRHVIIFKSNVVNTTIYITNYIINKYLTNNTYFANNIYLIMSKYMINSKNICETELVTFSSNIPNFNLLSDENSNNENLTPNHFQLIEENFELSKNNVELDKNNTLSITDNKQIITDEFNDKNSLIDILNLYVWIKDFDNSDILENPQNIHNISNSDEIINLYVCMLKE
jgi:hypothetical protein